MDSGKKLLRILIGLGIALLQLIMTQVTTLLASFLLPDIENFPQTHSALFALILGITFTTGVFLAGWLAIKLGWLKIKLCPCINSLQRLSKKTRRLRMTWHEQIYGLLLILLKNILIEGYIFWI